jgi:hypothetical protein
VGQMVRQDDLLDNIETACSGANGLLGLGMISGLMQVGADAVKDLSSWW